MTTQFSYSRLEALQLDQENESDSSDETVTQKRYDAEQFEAAEALNTKPIEDAMELAVRWSPLSTHSDPCFLIADVVGKAFKHCRIIIDRQSDLQNFQIEELSVIRVPAFRAFDWSPANNVVAVGQWSGETTVLALDTGVHILSLPIKSQRQCNAIAFSSENLLATGLERVRNDFCLNVYDINHCASTRPLQTSSFSSIQTIDPVRKLATSEGITSIKYFLQQPKTLVAGVKGTCVRIYDLREESTNPSLQYQTTCVHNLAVDYTDENYFASAAPPKENIVLVWDRRSTRRPVSTRQNLLDGSVLTYRRTPKEGEVPGDSNIWRLQYSSVERGCLGILSSSGSLRLYYTRKDYVESKQSRATIPDDNFVPTYAEELHTKHVETVEAPPRRRRSGMTDHDIDRVVSFDFTNLFTPDQRPCAITLRGTGVVRLYGLTGSRHPTVAVSSLSVVTQSRPRGITDAGDDKGIESAVVLMGAEGSGSVTDSAAGIQARFGANEDDDGLHTSKADLLHVRDALFLLDVPRRRCLEGYLFDCDKNSEITKYDVNLQHMWNWIKLAHNKAQNGNMISDGIDFSYLGVHGLWHQDIGHSDSRLTSKATRNTSVSGAIIALTQTLGLQDAGLPSTSKPDHRLLSLYTLDFSAKTGKLFSTVNNLAESGDNTQACLLALMFDNSDLALKALQSGPRKDNDTLRGLAMAITAFSLVEEAKMVGERKILALQRIKEALSNTKDQYAQAIAAYVTTGNWTDVISQVSLSLRYRVGIALRSLSDDALSTYLTQQTEHAIQHGKIQGLVLSGLTPSTLDLFQSYMERTSDLQSAVLAMSFVAPRLVRALRFDLWRRVYRAQLNEWKLYIERTHFDAQSTKLSISADGTTTLHPQPPQVTLRCTKCAEALHTDDPPEAQRLPPSASTTSSAIGGHHQGSIFGDTRSGTVCPKCHAHLPRCAICDLWLGVPDPRSRGSLTARRDAFADALEVCLSCSHMFHRGHAEQWFAGHEKCPVPDCECRCNKLDKGS